MTALAALDKQSRTEMSWEDIFINGSDIFLLLPSLEEQSKSEMGWGDIFYNGSNCVSVEIESIRHVNVKESSMAIHILKMIASILILLLVFKALYKMYGPKLTFINILVFLDIFNAAGHVPSLLLLTFEYVFNPILQFFS